MTLARNTALWLGLLSTLGLVETAVAQTAPSLHKDAAKRLTMPTADYEGEISIKIPSFKKFTAQVHYAQTDGHHLIRYDGPIPAPEILFFVSNLGDIGSFTVWADIDRSLSATTLHRKKKDHPVKSNIDVPSFANCVVVTVDSKQENGHTITHYHVDGCAVMKDHTYRGELYANEANIIVLAQGEEIKNEPGNRYTPLEIRLTNYIEKSQDASYVALPKPVKEAVTGPTQ